MRDSGLRVLFVFLAATVLFQGAPLHARSVSATYELNRLVWEHEQTIAALKQSQSAKLSTLMRQIDQGEDKITTLEQQLAKAKASAAERNAVEAELNTLKQTNSTLIQQSRAELETMHEQYRRQIAIIEGVGNRVLDVPGGEELLAAYNRGDAGSYVALDRLYDEVLRTSELAGRRERAALAADAYRKGMASLQNVIGMFERVLEIDPNSSAELWSLSALYIPVDLPRALSYLDRASAAEKLPGGEQYDALSIACGASAAVASIDRALAYCEQAKNLALAQYKQHPEQRDWYHRELISELNAIYLLYSYSRAAEGDARYSKIHNELNIVANEVILPRSYLQFFTNLILILRLRNSGKLDDPAINAQFLQWSEWLHKRLEYNAPHFVTDLALEMLRVQNQIDLATAQFYTLPEAASLKAMTQHLTRADELMTQLGVTDPSATADQWIDACRASVKLEDLKPAVDVCSKVEGRIIASFNRPMLPAERFKLDMLAALPSRYLATAQTLLGDWPAAAASNDRCTRSVEAVLAFPSIDPILKATWEENLLICAAGYIEAKSNAGLTTNMGSRVRPMLGLARAAAQKSGTPRAAQYRFFLLLTEALLAGEPVQRSEFEGQLEKVVALGFLPPDKLAAGRALARSIWGN